MTGNWPAEKQKNNRQEVLTVEKKQIESKVKELVAKCLPQTNPDSIVLEADFIALGIDSLAMSRLIAEIEDAFDIEVRIGDILKLKTLAAAVEYLEKRLAG